MYPTYGASVQYLEAVQYFCPTFFIDISKFIVQKVKFKHLGSTSGSVSEYRYNINNGRFAENGEQVFWDNAPYLQYEKPEGETVDELDDIPSCPTDQTNELPY